MADKIRLVQGDTGPQVQLTLTDDSTSNPIDLSGATATLHFRALGSDTALFHRTLYIPNATAAAGKAVIVWAEGDLDVEPGEYEGEIEIYWTAQSLRQTVYDLLKFKVRGDVA